MSRRSCALHGPSNGYENRSRFAFASHQTPSARNAKRNRLDIAGNVVIGFTDTLVAADFSVLPFALLHEGLKFGVVALGNCLGLHLDHEPAACRIDARPDVDNGLLKSSDALVLVQGLAGKDIQRWRNQLDLDLVLGSVSGLGAPNTFAVSTQS